MNTPYIKQIKTNSEGKHEVINPITKEHPYLHVIPNRQQRRMSTVYIFLVGGMKLKKHGNNRKQGKRKNSRIKRF